MSKRNLEVRKALFDLELIAHCEQEEKNQHRAAVFLAAWVLITRLLVPATIDPHVLALITRSREFLIVFVFLFFLFIGFREYVWLK